MWLLFLKIYKNPYIEEEQTTKWPKENVQKYTQRCTTTQPNKTKDGETRTILKTGVELGFSARVHSSWPASGMRRVNLVTNPIISHEWGNDREVFTTNGTYPWLFEAHIFDKGQPSHGVDRKLLKWWLQLNTVI